MTVDIEAGGRTLTRRRLLGTLVTGSAGLTGLTSYAFAYEPMVRLAVVRYDMALPQWPAGMPPMTVALISDIHAVEPWMSVRRIAQIVATANALKPDIILLLGDFVSHMRYRSRLVMPEEWAPALAGLTAPLGSFAILGNHDHWWPGGAQPIVHALGGAGIRVLVNDAIKINADGRRFWLAGTDSTYAPWRGFGPHGLTGGGDDMNAALAPCVDADPVLLMAHEPAQFQRVPERVMLTVSGHTHGGQVYLPFIGRPILRHSDRYVYGAYVEGRRRLLVTAGLGCSIAPVRFLVPPEIALLRIGPADAPGSV